MVFRRPLQQPLAALTIDDVPQLDRPSVLEARAKGARNRTGGGGKPVEAIRSLVPWGHCHVFKGLVS